MQFCVRDMLYNGTGNSCFNFHMVKKASNFSSCLKIITTQHTPARIFAVIHPAGTSVISALFQGFYNGGL